MTDASGLGSVPWLFLASLTLFSLLWLVALVPFSLAIIVPAHRPRLDAGSLFDVREALLALNQLGHPFHLAQRSETELRLEWDVVDATWYELFAQVKLSTSYQARLLLDEARREVRIHETLRHSNLFIGFDGWKPRFNFEHQQVHGMVNVVWTGTAYGIQPGWPPQIGRVYRFHLDTIWAVRQVEEAAREKGWGLRPVIWWFEATQASAAWTAALTPPFMRGWSRRRFWSALYGLSWLGLIGTVVAFVPLTPNNIGASLAAFGGIAGIHGLILGFWALLRRLNQRAERARARAAHSSGEPRS